MQTGEYLTTAGDDGNVAVFHVASMEEAFVYPHHRATLSTDMPPDFVRQQSKPVFTGGANGKLYLVRRNWLTGKSQETLLSEGDGPVTAIASNGTYVAWATAAHVRVWDLEREEPVCAVDAPPAAISASMTPARLCWEADSTLVVAWGLSLRVLRLQRSTQNDAIGVASTKAASRGTAAPTGDQAGTPAYAGIPHGDDAAEGKDAAPSGAEGANELGARVASGSLPAPQAHTTSSHNAVGQSPHASSTSSTNTGPASATMLLTMELDAVVVGAVPFGEHLAILWCVHASSRTCFARHCCVLRAYTSLRWCTCTAACIFAV
ncbi:hypothetical protein EON66_06305 [archaeon]|nr:MAG: hypothetical protein EON66_06305 [archaeon]